MIYVHSYGSNIQKRRLVEDVAWWFIDKQLPRYKNLDIQIDLIKLNDVDGSGVDYGQNEFEIEIDKRLRGDDLATCVLHELIHVEQHLRNLYDINKCDESMPYLDRPYEKDAYERSEILLKEYINSIWKDTDEKSTKVWDLVA